MTDRLKPPFSYFGAKVRIAPRIVDLFPPHVHYIEPYAGSLSVLLAKPASRAETVNDINDELVTFWRMLRDRPDDLVRVCLFTPHSRTEHALAYEPATDDLEVARRVWVRLAQGRGGHLTPTGWRRVANQGNLGLTVVEYLNAYNDRMAPLVNRLGRVSLECRPALDVIADYGGDPDNLLYVDPPYVGATRSGTRYADEMASGEDHVALAEALKSVEASVVLSGYPSALYEELYTGWHVTELAASTAQGNATRPGRATVEVLWSNRPLGPNGQAALM